MASRDASAFAGPFPSHNYEYMSHKSVEELHQDLEKASLQVNIGGIYSHFKNSENLYQVKNLVILEETDEVAVEYSLKDFPEIVFIRPLSSWLESVEWEGKTMPRFQLR